MKIEKYKKIKNDIYRMFLSTGEILDLYEDVIIKNNLLYKKELDEELLKKITIDNKYEEAYNISLKYISVRLRSINEIKVYLKKKMFEENIINTTIERLIKNNFLNDEIFTKAFVKDKLNFTSMGKYKILNELFKLKVNNEIVYMVLEDIDENIWIEKIEKITNKYLKSNKKYSGNILKNKIYIYLVNLGYDKDLVISTLNKYDF